MTTETHKPLVGATAPAQMPRGQTAFQMLVVSLIVLPIGSAIGFNIVNQISESRLKSARLDENALINGVEKFVRETGHAPAGLNELVPRFVKQLHQDPWGGNYQLEIRGDRYAVVSLGKSQKPGATEIFASHPLPQPNSQALDNERHSP